MESIAWRGVTRADAHRLITSMVSWTSPDLPTDPLHPGDVCWHPRFEEEIVRRDLITARRGADTVAVGLFDDVTLRLALAPGVRDDAEFAAGVALLDAYQPPATSRMVPVT